jgi:protein-disulfide isomerase
MTVAPALTRRLAVVAFAAAALMTTAADAPYRYQPSEGDMSMGKADAPVTVIEYASVACPHCATWDNEVFPEFKAKYIDTGKVRFVFRELLTADPQLAGAGFITARCAPPARYFDVVHDIMHQQADIYKGRELRGPLLEIAKRAGLTEEAWNACLANDAMIEALNARSDRNATLDDVNSTPTFVINGVKLTGEHDLAGLGAAITAAPPAAKPAPAPKPAAPAAKKR